MAHLATGWTLSTYSDKADKVDAAHEFTVNNDMRKSTSKPYLLLAKFSQSTSTKYTEAIN